MTNIWVISSYCCVKRWRMNEPVLHGTVHSFPQNIHRWQIIRIFPGRIVPVFMQIKWKNTASVVSQPSMPEYGIYLLYLVIITKGSRAFGPNWYCEVEYYLHKMWMVLICTYNLPTPNTSARQVSRSVVQNKYHGINEMAPTSVNNSVLPSSFLHGKWMNEWMHQRRR